MSQVVEAEIFDFRRATGLFEGVVDGKPCRWDRPMAT